MNYDKEQEEQRDYLSEAALIISDMTMLLPQKEHLIALHLYYQGIIKNLKGGNGRNNVKKEKIKKEKLECMKVVEVTRIIPERTQIGPKIKFKIL